MSGVVVTTPDREIRAERTFAAPRELVWRAWTEPDRIAQWWGPRGFTTTTATMDVRPGGTWRFIMHGPDRDYPNRIDYDEVDPPARLVYRHVDDGDTEHASFQVEVDFSEVAEGTRLQTRMIFVSTEDRDRIEREYGAIQGLRETLERLTEFLGSSSDSPVL